MTARVRLIHAQVRRLLIESGQWNAEIWGAPINQLHMAGTNLMFSVGVLAGLTRLGYRFDPAERESLVHLWRYAGYLLGVESELLAFSEHEGQKLLDASGAKRALGKRHQSATAGGRYTACGRRRTSRGHGLPFCSTFNHR
jgi:hypothetical protein